MIPNHSFARYIHSYHSFSNQRFPTNGTSQACNFIGVLEERHGAIAQTFHELFFCVESFLSKGNALRPASYLDVPGSL